MANKTAIVQGKIFPTTGKLIQELRDKTDARVILCTWNTEEIKNLDIDKCDVLLLEDPGAGPAVRVHDGHSWPLQNFNRQLVSAQEAIKMAGQGTVLKVRSDLNCVKNPFEKYIKTPVLNVDASNLKNKIWISSIMSCVPSFRVFSPSDWVYMGEYEDMKEWFNIKDISATISRYVMCCEQLFCVSNLTKTFKELNLDKITEGSKENKELTSFFFKENFIFTATRGTFGFVGGNKYSDKKDSDNIYMRPQV